MVRTLRLDKEIDRIQTRMNRTISDIFNGGETPKRRRTSIRLQEKRKMLDDIEVHPTKKYRGEPYIAVWDKPINKPSKRKRN